MKFHLKVHKYYIWTSINIFVALVAILSLFFKNIFTYKEAFFFVLPIVLIFYLLAIPFYKRTYLLVNNDSFDIYYFGYFKFRVDKKRIVSVAIVNDARGILALSKSFLLITLKDKSVPVSLKNNAAFEAAIRKIIDN